MISSVIHRKLTEVGVSEEDIQQQNLTNYDLSGCEFSSCDLRGFIFNNTKFIECTFLGADLRGISFTFVDCTKSCFCGADMRGTKLSNGCFFNADFGGSDLRGAIIEGALLGNCDFSGADLRHAFIGSEIKKNDLRGADLRGAVLKGIDLKKLSCRLEGALFTHQPSPMDYTIQRSLPRYVLNYLVSAFEIPSMRKIGTIINISTDGFKLAGPISFPFGREVKIRLVFPKNLNGGNAFDVTAICRWNNRNDVTQQSFCGFQITVISESGKAILNDVIKEHTDII